MKRKNVNSTKRKNEEENVVLLKRIVMGNTRENSEGKVGKSRVEKAAAQNKTKNRQKRQPYPPLCVFGQKHKICGKLNDNILIEANNF
jgi:hypothetical protein